MGILGHSWKIWHEKKYRRVGEWMGRNVWLLDTSGTWGVWLRGWRGGCLHGWMDGSVCFYVCFHVTMYVWYVCMYLCKHPVFLVVNTVFRKLDAIFSTILFYKYKDFIFFSKSCFVYFFWKCMEIVSSCNLLKYLKQMYIWQLFHKNQLCSPAQCAM